MIAIWMLYASVLSLCLGLAALALEHAARLWKRPRRLVWAGAIAASLLAPAAALVIPGAPAPSGALIGSAWIEDLVIGTPPAARAPSAGRASARRSIAEALAALNRPLLLLWGTASLALALGLLRSAIRLRRRARAWKRVDVNGTEVLVARDVGPAVMRLDGLKVVLPEWALDAEPAARALMLLHESEHRRARDPDLLLGATVALMLVPWAFPLWWQVRRLQLAVETDCDRRVMRAGVDAHAYGVLLLSVGAVSARHPLLVPTAFSEARSLLERRIEAMHSSKPKRRIARTALAVGLGALAVAAACVTPRPVPAPAQQVAPPPAQQAVPAPALQPATPPQRPVQPAHPPALASVQQGERVFSEDSVEERPERLSGRLPVYPDSLKTSGIGGRVVLEAIVDPAGHVDSASVRTLASSHPAFERAAREALLGTTFRPGRADGRAVSVRVRIPFGFAVAVGPARPQPPPGVFPEDSVAERPRLLSRPWLAFPDGLRAFGDSLRMIDRRYLVFVEAIVDSTGHVEPGTVRILESWHPGFDSAARAAVVGSVYAPGQLNGHAVPVMIRIPLEFEPRTAPAPRP